MTRLTLLLVSLMLTAATAGGANKVTLLPASGTPGSEVEVGVALQSDPGAVAMQLTIPIPEGVEYLEGSCVRSGNRLSDHSVSADLNGDRLVILVYNVALREIAPGSGEVLKLKLRLGTKPGSYLLTPSVKLSDASGRALQSSAEGAEVTVRTPEITVQSSPVDFGRVAIRGSYTRTLQLSNTGNEPLTVSGITTTTDRMTVSPASLTVSPGSSGYVTLTYAPLQRAASVEEQVTVRSDAVNGDARLTVKAVPFSVNELHMDRTQGNSGQEITVTVRMNNMEPITAADFTVNLPAGITYVEGSAQTAQRAEGHSITSNCNGNTLRIVMFHPANRAVDGNDGELLTFRIKAMANSGYYSLNPENVKLVNPGGENMTSASEGNYIVIAAPSMNCESEFDMGDNPFTEPMVKPLTIANNGQAPLVIDRVVFLSDGFSVETPLPLTVAPYGNASLQVRATPAVSGPFSAVMNIYSNDPDEPMKAIKVSGRAFEPNKVTVTGEPSDDYDAYTMHFNLENFTPIVALQLDVDWLPGMTATKSDMHLSGRASGHSFDVAKLADGKWRIVIFSLSNTPFSGSDGNLFDLTFHGTDFVGSKLKVSGIKLSGNNGVNYISPDAQLLASAIEAVKASTIELSATTATLKATETLRLTAKVLPSNALDRTVTWRSSDEAVATVNGEGTVTAVAVGNATVTASCGDVAATCAIEVVATPAASIALDRYSVTIRATESVKLSATVLPPTATDRTVTWRSSDEAVATVNGEGTVTAVAVGNATVTASCGDVEATCAVEVVPTPAASIVLDRSIVTIRATESVKLSATVIPSTTTDKTVTWRSSDEAVATVNGEGTVTAVSVGNATVTASCGDVAATCAVEVVPTPAASIVLDRSSVTLKATESVKLSATVLPPTATDRTVTWRSSDEDVATVTGEGTVTAVAVGNATVTATCGDVAATCAVEVVPTPAASIVLDRSSVTLRATESVKLSATVLPPTATDRTVTWRSSDEAVATVTGEGTVTAVAVGNATVTASCGDVSATCAVEVVPTPAASIALDRSTLELRIGQSDQLTATLGPATATDKGIEWSSLDPAIVKVDLSGIITAISVGETTVTARSVSNPSLTASCTIKVNPILAETLTLNMTDYAAEAGTEFKLVATVTPDDTTDKSLSWSSDDASVATVDQKGTVKVLSEGECLISVCTTDGSNLTATCRLSAFAGITGIKLTDAPAEFFNLQGVRVDADNLTPGIYIMRKGNDVKKVLVK